MNWYCLKKYSRLIDVKFRKIMRRKLNKNKMQKYIINKFMDLELRLLKF